MKPSSTGLAGYLASSRPSGDLETIIADCYTFTLAAGSLGYVTAGQTLGYTNFDVPVALNGAIYAADQVMVSGLKYRCAMGVAADEQEITLSAWPQTTIGGIPFLQAVQQGLLDGATIQRDRAFLVSLAGAPPLAAAGSVTLFKGRVGEITSVGRTTASVKVASDLTLLTIDMPRNLYQPNCLHKLYDSGCTLVAVTYTFNGVCAGGSSSRSIVWSGASSQFRQGKIVFTTGANTGVVATIKDVSGTAMALAYPLPVGPAAGDSFTASWGCDHSFATCGSVFSNQNNFRGFPYVPPPPIITGPLSSTSTGRK